MQKICNPFESLLAEILDVKSQLEEIKKYLNQPVPVPEEEAFLTSIEVAEVFGVSTVTIWQWTKKGCFDRTELVILNGTKNLKFLLRPSLLNTK